MSGQPTAGVSLRSLPERRQMAAIIVTGSLVISAGIAFWFLRSIRWA